ncbi:cytochrome c oxidase accessory protein CcoG [Pokkaliibacter sp. MBI-7]|uniref:cytochrome c oxidase accessory protein CcoG n=1 Tax=Pokkaliibacter sp. MBI-7 TaxID=3040600 RepID=UPI00244C3F1F|nr:cytochrome c oxidase accessory protein CcoG [Pokkaliibacter sp. MBI-7]MDH2435112.1 cytochrome c oxidase accessory protein CcoG [Pokkaliibacter sp. MBI-7]
MSKIPVKDISPQPDVEIVDLYAKRTHIYTKSFSGLFRNLRMVAGWALLIGFFGVSWLTWDGQQAVHFDLPNRQFHIFGVTLFPQDFILLSWLLIILAFTLFFVTVFAGRLWCGYSCPQSVWTWMFMWVEKVTEGDRNQRMKLDKQRWSFNKFRKKLAKHVLWLLISLGTAFAFLGYFTPVRELLPNILHLHLGPWESWWLLFFTLATYGNAGWLREQVCIYMCPYARFQSVMFDRDTLIVSYDAARGEPRGSRKRNVDPKSVNLGDCIDCDSCVHVCPTGIDIRNGLQYECIGCAACIDVCDDIMSRMGYAKGLIRYTTEHQLEGGQTHILRPRLIGYGVALLVMTGAFFYTIGTRVPLELDIMRDRQQLYTLTPDQRIQNLYELRIANKSQQAHSYTISITAPARLELLGGNRVTLQPSEVLTHNVQLVATDKKLSPASFDVQFIIKADDADDHIEVTNRFIGPVQ